MKYIEFDTMELVQESLPARAVGIEIIIRRGKGEGNEVTACEGSVD